MFHKMWRLMLAPVRRNYAQPLECAKQKSEPARAKHRKAAYLPCHGTSLKFYVEYSSVPCKINQQQTTLRYQAKSALAADS